MFFHYLFIYVFIVIFPAFYLKGLWPVHFWQRYQESIVGKRMLHQQTVGETLGWYPYTENENGSSLSPHTKQQHQNYQK